MCHGAGASAAAVTREGASSSRRSNMNRLTLTTGREGRSAPACDPKGKERSSDGLGHPRFRRASQGLALVHAGGCRWPAGSLAPIKPLWAPPAALRRERSLPNHGREPRAGVRGAGLPGAGGGFGVLIGALAGQQEIVRCSWSVACAPTMSAASQPWPVGWALPAVT